MYYVVVAASLLLGACASTTIETTGARLSQPLCEPGGPPLSTVVYWGPQWRPDQKEPQRREAAAEEGLRDFLSRTACLDVAGVHRLPAGAAVPADGELLRMAADALPTPERVLLVVVRELGPTLLIGLPVLLEGATEVIVEVRVLDVHDGRTLADARTHWRNGGKLVVKGVRTLGHDMDAALAAALTPSVASSR